MFQIERYTPDFADNWNAFVARAKNGTFLFDRHYMDYHSDRFCDHSLVFLDEAGQTYALLPANEAGQTFYTHQGLTYGGLIMDEKVTAAHVCELFALLNDYLATRGFQKVVYKPVPSIFHTLPAQEDLFALTAVCHAQLTRRDLSSAVDLHHPVKWRRDRRYAANKAERNGIAVAESDDWAGFWHILNDNLMARFGAKPVHTIEEITLLKSRMPENIRLWTALKDGKMMAGTVIYQHGRTAHAQYISASPEGKRLHAVDALFKHLLLQAYEGYDYFNFGTSNLVENDALNLPLIYQKEGFGGRGICYDRYEWNPCQAKRQASHNWRDTER